MRVNSFRKIYRLPFWIIFPQGRRPGYLRTLIFKFLEGDVRDVEFVESYFDQFRPTHVVHAAASYADPYDWTGDFETNTRGSLNVAQAAEKAGVSHLIYLQTALGYGKPTVTPIPLRHSLQPTTSYSISKVAGEYYILGS